MTLRVAVAGSPNSGKSTLFNALTGARAKVANYPGVTVERKIAPFVLPNGQRAELVDLPGCYSLTAHSAEEEVAHHVLVGELDGKAPDVLVCAVDATQLSRGSYLAMQLLELGRPVVIAATMMDSLEARGQRLDTALLAQRLGAPVVAVCARTGRGLDALRRAVAQAAGTAVTARPVAMTRDERATLEALRATLELLHFPSGMGTALWLVGSRLHELSLPPPPAVREAAEAARQALDRDLPGSFSRRVILGRYQAIDEALADVVTEATSADSLTRRIDRVLLHPVLGFAVFAAVMLVVFQAIFAWANPFMDGVEWFMGEAASAVQAWVPEGLTQSLLVHGLIGGVGNVLVFIPQIAFLFLLVALLEESGYLARAAVLTNGLMARVGLQGKSFVPMLSGFACAVPAIMSARTIESRRDRLVTILVTPFMSCSARLPVYVLVISAVFATAAPVWGLFSVAGLVMTGMYVLGILAALGTAALLRRTTLRGAPMPLLLELPPYRLPILRVVLASVLTRAKVFVTQTGPIIMALSVVLWALLNFPRVDMIPAAHASPAGVVEISAAEAQAAQLRESFAGRLGRAIEPVIEPLGFDWRLGIGLIASFAAREVLVSTLGQVYALGEEADETSPALRDALRADLDPATGKPRFSPLVGVSLMVFFVLAMQCLSTVATVKRETNSWRWAVGQLVYMNALAYMASLVVYQGGRWLGYG